MPRAKQFDREEVLQKAMLLFWKQGYHHTSVQDLVDFLGINRASLYATFGGKKELFDLAFAAYRTANLTGLANFLSQQQDVKSGLRQIFTRLITSDAQDPEGKGCLIANSTTELLPGDPALKDLLTAHQRETEQLFVDFLRQGVERGQISPTQDLPTFANLLYTLMTGLRVVGKTRANIAGSLAAVEAVLSLLDG